VKKAKKPEVDIFADAADLIAVGVNALFEQEGVEEFEVDLDDIEIIEQIRTYTDEDEEDLRNLGKSLRVRQLHPLWLRIMPEGHPKPYRLVSGEGRYRGARFEGLSHLKAKALVLTDEEAEDLQFIENVQRKNLKQIEEATKLQRDIERLGSVEAVLEKYHISRSRLSKLTGLLHLPEQTKRLLKEGLSADVEAISDMKAIEKVDPQAAKALVDELKETRGKGKVRDKVAKVKARVKSPKKSEGEVATPFPEREVLDSNARPAPVRGYDPLSSTDPFVQVRAPELDPVPLLEKAYDFLVKGACGELVVNMLTEQERPSVLNYLKSVYQRGHRSQLIPNSVVVDIIEGWGRGDFGPQGAPAIRLAAFLWGARGCKTFEVTRILESTQQHKDGMYTPT